MKKKIAIMISFMMIMTFALAACGGGGDADLSDSKYVGTWRAASISAGGNSEDVDFDYILTLDGDGTGTFLASSGDGDEISDITWSLTDSGFKTKGGTKLKFTDDGEGIITSILGVKLHFDRVNEQGEEVVDFVDGAAYGYAGDDPYEAACYEYMAEVIGKQYAEAEISIPTVNIVKTDDTAEDEVLMYGDFWVENYNVNGDTLECVSGGNHPGVMHVSKTDYTVTAFDQVADGEAWEESAKELFGDAFDDFFAVSSDTEARDELRRITVSDYVTMNGLDINYYHDEGWDPVELYRD